MSGVKPRRREIAAALTRAAVLDAARSLFIAKGFDATSIDEIARASESSNGAVYQHFRDKRDIFAELFRSSQVAILQNAIAVMPADATAWQSIELATRAFFQGYVGDGEARALLRQVVGVLGWDRVREIDEEMSLPLIRTTLAAAIEAGEVKPVPVSTAAEILFNLYCNAVLVIAADPDPAQAAADSQAVIFTLLSGMRVDPAHHAGRVSAQVDG